jgi:hypothetical protein
MPYRNDRESRRSNRCNRQDSDSGVISWNGSSGGMKVISRSTSNFDSRTHWWNLAWLTGYISLARHPHASAHEMILWLQHLQALWLDVNWSQAVFGDSYEDDACTAINDVKFIQRFKHHESTQGKIASTCPLDFPVFPPHYLSKSFGFYMFLYTTIDQSFPEQDIATWPTYNRLRRSLCRYFALAPQRSLERHWFTQSFHVFSLVCANYT